MKQNTKMPNNFILHIKCDNGSPKTIINDKQLEKQGMLTNWSSESTQKSREDHQMKMQKARIGANKYYFNNKQKRLTAEIGQ